MNFSLKKPCRWCPYHICSLIIYHLNTSVFANWPNFKWKQAVHILSAPTSTYLYWKHRKYCKVVATRAQISGSLFQPHYGTALPKVAMPNPQYICHLSLMFVCYCSIAHFFSIYYVWGCQAFITGKMVLFLLPNISLTLLALSLPLPFLIYFELNIGFWDCPHHAWIGPEICILVL